MLKLENITKTFNIGAASAKKALDGIDLDVKNGDFITIIGSNGAGKSTLFGAICGDFYTDSGSIILDGDDVTMLPAFRRAKNIGRLFQDPMRGTAPVMTIEENLALAAGMGGWLSHVTRKERDIFREKLSVLGMGLEDMLEQQVGLLSGGQRQALTLLMATFNPPKILLLDEHTAALDPATADVVIGITREMVEQNSLTCLMVTHNMRSALEMGNRTIMMDRGKIIYDVSGEERKSLTVSDLTDRFSDLSGRALDNDRMLLGI